MRAATGAVVLAAMTLGVVGCSGTGGSGDASDVVEPAVDQDPVAQEPLTATFTEETFVDATRPTSASPFAPASDQRELVTRIAYPEPLAGKLPLIVLAHGLTGDPAKFTELMTMWAEAGYVVAAPAFPRSTEAQPGGAPAADPNDVVNQPADVSFVLDEMVRLGEDHDSPLFDHVDAERVGLAGHSLGGLTAYGVVFSSCCRDERVDAVLLMAMAPPMLLDNATDATFDDRDGSVPTLMMVADEDFIYEATRDAYPQFTAPKWLVTMHGGNVMRHATPFEDAPDPSDDLVYATTTAFWDLELRDDGEAEDRMAEAAQPADGSATLQEG